MWQDYVAFNGKYERRNSECKWNRTLGIIQGFVWLEGWKSGIIENSERLEKWEYIIDFVFSPFCLVGSGKVEGQKKWVWINLLIYSC